MTFVAIGTKKLWIGSGRKCASTTIHKLYQRNSLNQKFFMEDEMKEDVKFVVVIRNVWEKWRSGMLTDCPYVEKTYDFFDHTKTRNWGPKDEDGKFSLKFFYDDIVKHHSVDSDLSWMWNKDHTRFWEWNNDSLNSLGELCKRKNVYFLELSKLNSLEFREWCVSHEPAWKSIETIKTNNTSPSAGYNNFWRLYEHGGILRNSELLNPIKNLPFNKRSEELMFYKNLATEEQTFLNDIRNTNKNYLNLK